MACGLDLLFVDPVLGGWRPRYQLLLGKPQFNFAFGTLGRVAAVTNVPTHKTPVHKHSLKFNTKTFGNSFTD